MRKNPTLSIIVPAYNVQRYLEKCIKSILCQTFEDFELLLINDGSTDESGKICDEFAKKDKRIKVFHQENKGVSSARNIGLEKAKGEYLSFVDGDDWCDENMLEAMYEKAKPYKADVVVCGYKLAYSKIIETKNINITKSILNQKEAICNMLELDGFGGYVWNKMIRSELVKKHDVKFDIYVNYKEDLYFFYNVFCNARKIYFFPKAFYNYKIDEKKDTISKRELKFFTSTQKIINSDKRKSIIKKAKTNQVFSALSFYMTCTKNNYNDRVKKYYKKHIFRYIFVFLCDFSVIFKYKIYVIMTICPKCFFLMHRLKSILKSSKYKIFS